jgi:hypothetical protein
VGNEVETQVLNAKAQRRRKEGCWVMRLTGSVAGFRRKDFFTADGADFADSE